MYSEARYHSALVKLGPRVSEGQRRMLAVHASAGNSPLDVLALARAAGQVKPQYTYSQYGRLGRLLARALGHRMRETVWTRLIGEDSRNPRTGRVQWRMHAGLVGAVQRLGWVGGVVSPTAEKDIQAAKDELEIVDNTTRQALIEARLKQGEFRQRLVSFWGSCAVTGCDVLEALTASHIKPWRDASNSERLNVYNGLLLLGTLDRLFDAGLITFAESGSMQVSPVLSKAQRRALGLLPQMRLRQVAPKHHRYLAWHRERVFVEKLS